MRLLNYNVHHFVGANDVNHFVDINSLASLINNQEVDIVTLQELDVNTRRSGIALDQLAELAKRTKMSYKFGKTIDYAGGDYGIGILSKYPIVKSAFYPLSSSSEQEEKRGLLVCTLDLGHERELTVATTHLASQSNASRVLQAKEVIQLAKENKIDLLTGDFNATEKEEPIQVLKQGFEFDSRFKNQFTIPTQTSTKKIDFIVKALNSAILFHRQSVYSLESLSDHNMIIADFSLE
ncbi:endonuclease/exonuclease/phosphatase family protein [Myroides marinus]|uniref:endonuclease/exonuclease/phosphatase family protein n=1 Tax=Myroides marinus TaxID=703342 RepID=UPI0009B887E0|nr:endonuclease/exonuclease/phosphatase family protein [Myroides marinus]